MKTQLYDLVFQALGAASPLVGRFTISLSMFACAASSQAQAVPRFTFLAKPYHLGSFNQRSKPMWEFAAPGETVLNWTTLVTLIERTDAQTQLDVDRLSEGVKSNYESHGGHLLLAKTMKDSSGAPFNYMVVAFDESSQRRLELNFVKIALGPKSAYTMVYGVRVTDPADYRIKAELFLDQRSSEIGKALEIAKPPDMAALPRQAF